MTCVAFHGGIYCYSPSYRLRLLDGRYVYMDWHSHLGPSFFRDRALARPMDGWWDDDMMCAAAAWFANRGCRA